MFKPQIDSSSIDHVVLRSTPTTMGQYWECLQPELIPWIVAQKLFWVATSPLSPDGHINVSPKGVDGSFHVINERKVWYEDLTGSGMYP